MKKSIVFLLLIVPFTIKAVITYTSTTNGNWTSVIWFPAGTPTSSDNVVIATSVTLNVSASITNVTVNNGATLALNSGVTLSASGSISNSGTISGGGSGSINLTGALTISGTGAGVSFMTGSLNIGGNFINDAAFGAGTGTVTFTGASAQTIGGTIPTTFYNLTIASGTNTTTLSNNQTISHDLTINSSATLDASASGNFNLTIGRNFSNNGTFVPEMDTVIMDGTVNQTISAPSGSMSLYNLTSSSADTVFTGCSITMGNNLTVTSGVLDCEGNQITGPLTGGTLGLAAGTSLILGLPSSGAVSFPTNYTAITLDPLSTVIYQADAGQTISGAPPAYGNLVLSSGSSSTTKTAGTALTVAGNLTINANTTLSGISRTLFLGGNLTSNGGTYTVGTSTVDFDGSGVTQVIGGTSPISSFYNMTVSGRGTQVVQPSSDLTITNELIISSGVLDVTSASYSLLIANGFSAGSNAFIPHNDTVTMYGSSPTLGANHLTLPLNKLVVGKTSTANLTLVGNITAASDITISSVGTLNASGVNINIAGNFIDNGTFNCNTGTVDFDNNGRQCVSGVHTSETFENLTISPMSILGTSCNINIDGTILILPGGLMACACH